MNHLELWGGVECTINRVGDTFHDQLRGGGIGAIDPIADLGITAFRYPLLWERGDDVGHWERADTELAQLRACGVRPIAGLIHHGSGPVSTNLLDPGFGPGLAEHARNMVTRNPWIDDWTPVNEPLTTARFSALYGFWYPHLRDEAAFWLALVNQIDGIRLSMREIRRINTQARLIQTEDLGRTYATAPLSDQAGFDNLRRWMTWDLLCGRVDRQHPLWARLARYGLADRLRAIADDRCPPDIIGINHYLTSDRFLDHRVHLHPEQCRGGNGAAAYADTEAVRSLISPPDGLRGVITETWDRYGITVAITESHNSSTRDEQMRWTAEAWDTAGELRNEGLDVCAVAVWALLGSRNWNSLLTRDEGHFECGTFDPRGGILRETAMVPMLKGFARGTPERHPVLDNLGWWHGDARLNGYALPRTAGVRSFIVPPLRSTIRPILITGASGTLGNALARACRARNLDFVLTDRSMLNLEDEASIASALAKHNPWAVINAAGWVRVDEAEHDPDGCYRVNTDGALALAKLSSEAGSQYVGFSSDLVFDGTKDATYDEDDKPAPLNIYGHSKARADAASLGLIVRTAAFFSPWDEHNFAFAVCRSLSAGQRFAAAADYFVSPTFVPDLVDAVLDLTIDNADGIWHLTNGSEISWAEFACRIARSCGLDDTLIDAVEGQTLGWIAKRPKHAGLATFRGSLLPPLDNATARFALA